MHTETTQRAGLTLLELLVTITVIGLLATLAIVRSARILDTVSVRGAQYEVLALFGFARDVALGRQHATAIHIDSTRGTILAADGPDTLTVLRLGERGIRVVATRDSMAYNRSGLGYGAANLRLALSRGAAAETVTVSRLGRVEGK